MNTNTPINGNVTSTTATSSPPLITTVTQTKVVSEAQLQTLVSGILANVDSASSLPISGATYTVTDLVARIQERIAAAEKTKASKNQWHSDVQSERQVAAALRPLIKGMQRYVEGRYGEDSAKLAEFGFTPRKPRKVTAKTKADAAVKAEATRKVRNTVGKKQRLAITAPPPAASPQPTPPQSATAPVAPPTVAGPPAATGAHPTTGGAS
jgi:hypothetical protein